MHPLRDKTAIVGIGASPQGKLPGSTALSLAVEAFKRALGDSGLAKRDIDGLLTFPGTTAPEEGYNYLRLGETLGIDPRSAEDVLASWVFNMCQCSEGYEALEALGFHDAKVRLEAETSKDEVFRNPMILSFEVWREGS